MKGLQRDNGDLLLIVRKWVYQQVTRKLSLLNNISLLFLTILLQCKYLVLRKCWFGVRLSKLSDQFHLLNDLRVGALTFGLLVDVIGRRWAFNLTCLITSVFGLLLVCTDRIPPF